MKDLTIITRGPSWKECEFRTKELWGDVCCLVTPGMEDYSYNKLFAFDGENVGVKGLENPILTKALGIARGKGISIVSDKPYATEPFPAREVIQKLKSSYFMPTVSFMIAYALYLDYKRLFIHGIDQGPQWEYQSGKMHVMFWIGVATGMGVEVIMGRNSLWWAYKVGIDGLPDAFFLREGIRIVHHLDSIYGYHGEKISEAERDEVVHVS